MAALRSIKDLVKALQWGKRSDQEIKVEANLSAVEQIIDILKNKNYVKVKNISGNEYTLKVNKNSNIEMDCTNASVRARKIHELAAKRLPSVTGTLIISTPKGMMAHVEAYEQKQGGRVMVVAY